MSKGIIQFPLLVQGLSSNKAGLFLLNYDYLALLKWQVDVLQGGYLSTHDNVLFLVKPVPYGHSSGRSPRHTRSVFKATFYSNVLYYMFIGRLLDGHLPFTANL